MGPQMKRLKNALAWNGTNVTMSMFIISPDREPPPLALGSLIPRTVKTYELSDEDNVVGSHNLFEYDLIWDELPEPIEGIVTTAIKDAIRKGAILAWFGFEGSFDFHYILHPEIARQVYAVANPESVWLAIDDDVRSGLRWQQTLAELRAKLLSRLNE